MDIMKQDHPPEEPMDHPASRRSVPPPPPSRRASIAQDTLGSAASVAPISQSRPTLPSSAPTVPTSAPTVPGSAATPLSSAHTLPTPTPPPPSQRMVSSIPGSPLKPRLGSTPIAELNRVRDPVRALHERELEHLREQHQQTLAQVLLDKETELSARDLAHQAHIDALLMEHRTQLEAMRAEHESDLVSMRRRVAAAAHLALEDRQGLLRHLEDENQQMRTRVHELERLLDLPQTVFSERPRTPSLPPEMFISPNLPAPAAVAALAPIQPLVPDETPLSEGAQAASQRAATHDDAPDDLTRLRGVGPAIARGLIQLGVTKFSQIASWTDADIERIAPRLRTRPNRIRKDGWVKSAQRLHEEV